MKLLLALLPLALSGQMLMPIVGGGSAASKVATPTFSPDGGSSTDFVLAISDATSGASVTYCSGASDCNPVGGTAYTGTILITSTAHYCAYAAHAGMADSATHCATFTVGVTYLSVQDFEGSGTPSGWQHNYGGPIDWHSTTQYHDGTKALLLGPVTTTWTEAASSDLGSSGTLYGKFWMYLDYQPDAMSIVFANHIDGVGDPFTLYANANGTLRVLANGGTGVNMTQGIPTNTWIRVWYAYTPGSGSDAAFSAWWATTDNHPGNSDAGYYALSTGGTYTANPSFQNFLMDYVGSVHGSTYFDSILASNSILWVPPPNFDVSGGIDLANDQSVTITDAGTSIYYCMDTAGSCTPGTSYASPVTVTPQGATTHLRANATRSGYSGSPLVDKSYTYKVATPSSSPSLPSTQSSCSGCLTFADATTDAYICYTTDGGTPAGTGSTCTTGTHYSGALSAASTTTYKWAGFKANYTDSAVASGTLTIAAAYNCGETGTATGSQVGWNGNFVGNDSCTPSSNASVTSCVVTLSAYTSGSLECGVYATSGNVPTGNPICSGSATPSGSGEVTIPMSGCGTLTSGTKYAIVVNENNSAMGYASVASNGLHGFYNTAAYGTFPPSGTSWSSYSVFALLRNYLVLQP